MSSNGDIPRIGVGVFVLNENNEFIFGQRKGSHGQGTWALPGGHLELNESFEDCATRETLEETGIEIKDVQFLTAVNSPRIDQSKHYVTIFMVARPAISGTQPQLLEPTKCEGWHWMSWETMLDWYEYHKSRTGLEKDGVGQKILFAPMMNLVEQRPGVRPLLP